MLFIFLKLIPKKIHLVVQDMGQLGIIYGQMFLLPMYITGTLIGLLYNLIGIIKVSFILYQNSKKLYPDNSQ
jgi:hypothetical protein